MLLQILLATMASASVGPATMQSWGKAGVSFDQYREDAFACAKVGFYRDVSEDEAAKRFIVGTGEAERRLNRGDGINPSEWMDSISRTQPRAQMKTIHDNQVSASETCLMDRGYHRFTLSPAQARKLSRLKIGSSERRLFLYELATRQP